VITVVFNNNKISKLEPFGLARKYDLKIMNLSFDSNEIADFEELDALKQLNLRELVLSNNPVGAGIDEVTYKLEVVRRLPELGFLDTKKIKAGADSHPITRLPPIQGNFFDTPERKIVAEVFLQRYFESYDGDRNLLLDAYAEQSCFSLALVPLDSKPHGRGGSSFKRGEKFVPYAALDRNLKTITSIDSRTTALKTGPTHITGMLLDLPPTKHDYESFTVDCFVSNLGTLEMLNIFVHGSFLESSKTQRSFSRVFLIVPSPAGSKSQQNGWPGIIINDQFYLRHFTPKRVKPPPPQIPTAAVATSLAEKQAMVLRLAEITSMTIQYAEQCLTFNAWNYEQALANFTDLKTSGRIPPEAFAPKQQQQ